ncbi:MAG: putative sugar nucleotidyl transferase [Cyclobacteriaceae bacterium]|nr:putative sugar nucleotidyl transferase [Cyclobacteriaceae bacterium]
MNLILFDDPIIKDSLLPLTYTRPVAEIRVGIQKISEKWIHLSQSEVGFWTEDYLSIKFPGKISDNCIIVNGAICPDSPFINIIQTLEKGRGLKKDNFILAYRMASTDEITLSNLYGKVLDQCEEFEGQITIISKPWHIFQKNAEQLKLDFDRITKGRKSMELTDPYTVIYKSENVFIEEGAQVKAAIIDAENGPVYIGKNTIINIGAVIRGSWPYLIILKLPWAQN